MISNVFILQKTNAANDQMLQKMKLSVFFFYSTLVFYVLILKNCNAQSPPLKVTAGKGHACVYLSGRCAYCFGDNAVSQTGTGILASQVNYPERAPISWPGTQMSRPVSGPLWPVNGFDAGGDTTCATSGNSETMCWGSLGPPGGATPTSNIPVPHGHAGFPVRDMSTSGQIVCTIDVGSANMIQCVGDFGARLLPNGQRQAVLAMDIINPNAVEFVATSAGFDHACGLDQNRDVWCVGQNSHGQAMVSAVQFVDTNMLFPPGGVSMQLNSGYSASAVVASREFTAILSTTGQLYLYGRDEYGGLWGPNPLSNIHGIKSTGLLWSEIDCGRGFCCGVRTTGTLQCFGNNKDYRVAPSSTAFTSTATITTPTTLFLTAAQQASWGAVRHVGTGDDFACATFATHSIGCWGKALVGFGPTPGDVYLVGAARCDAIMAPSAGPGGGGPLKPILDSFDVHCENIWNNMQNACSYQINQGTMDVEFCGFYLPFSKFAHNRCDKKSVECERVCKAVMN